MSMFQISRRADYAVRIMVELGLLPTGELAPARVVARRTGVPKAFLHKINNDLSRAGLVRTVSGASGGVSLALPPDEITMLRILEAVEGPVLLNNCLLQPGECPRDAFCPAHGFFDELQSMLVERLQACTLADLVRDARELRRRLREQAAAKRGGSGEHSE